MSTSVAEITFDNDSIETTDEVSVESEDDDVTFSSDYQWSTYCSSTAPEN